MELFAKIELQTVGIIVGIVVPAVAGAAFIVSKAFKLGKISNRLETVESDTKEIKNDIKDLRDSLTRRIDELLTYQTRSGLAESNSPMKLSQKGRKVLEDSGIHSVVDEKYDEILEKVKELDPKNSYQAEQAVFTAVQSLEKDPAINDAIEEGAFNSGYVKASVVFVGGLYIRDKILNELDFNVDDIDKHNPAKTE